MKIVMCYFSPSYLHYHVRQCLLYIRNPLGGIHIYYYFHIIIILPPPKGRMLVSLKAERLDKVIEEAGSVRRLDAPRTFVGAGEGQAEESGI